MLPFIQGLVVLLAFKKRTVQPSTKKAQDEVSHPSTLTLTPLQTTHTPGVAVLWTQPG